MLVVIPDASPQHYLVPIKSIDLLPRLFETVNVSTGVLAELSDDGVRAWRLDCWPSLGGSMNEILDPCFAPVGATEGDTLLRLAHAFHQEDGHPLSQAGERAVMRIALGEPLARAWFARRSGEIIGYVIITVGYSIEYGGRDGFIDDLYLVPAARGQGVGRKLLGFALAQAAALGIGTLHLEVEMDNARAARLYRTAGFEETGRALMRCRLDVRQETIAR